MVVLILRLIRFFSLLIPIWLCTDAGAEGTESNRLLILGDSLSAGYNLDKGKSWVDYVAQSNELSRMNLTVFNASFSGETSSGGLSRLPGLLQRHQPNFVLIILGGNDGLRGLPLKELSNNLDNIFKVVREAKAIPLYAGVDLPPNFGKPFTEEFRKVQNNAAKRNNVTYLEFLLEPIYKDRSNFMPDGIHPNLNAQEKIGRYVLNWLVNVLSQ